MELELKKSMLEQPKGLGLIGDKIIALAKSAQAEIMSKWNEATMEKIKKNGIRLVGEATAFEIVDEASYRAANESFVCISQYKKEGGEFIEPLVEAMHQPHAMTCDIRREFYDPADTAKKILEKKIGEWKTEQRKLAEALQNRLNAERRAKEEAERQRLAEKARFEQEKADQARHEAEQKAVIERARAEKEHRAKAEADARAKKAETDRMLAEKAAKDSVDAKTRQAAQAEVDRLENECKKAETEAAERGRAAFEAEQQAHKEISKGEIAAQEHEQKSDAHLINSENVFTPPSITLPTINKTEITASGKSIGIAKWDVTIVDEMELVKAVARGTMAGGFPISVLSLDPEKVKAALKRWAKMSVTTQRYADNGVVIEAGERLSSRANSKAKQD